MKIYPSGPTTRHGSQMLLEGTEPLIIYTSADNGIKWYLNGGLAPFPGVQEGAFLSDGAQGLHPPFSFAELKAARQHGVTTQHTVFDPAEMDLQVEFSVPHNQASPTAAAAAIRRVIRDWMESWDPKNPGTLDYITPENGRWTCNPRLFRAPPDRVLRAQSRRLRQKYTWVIRNDDAFWRGVDSISTFTVSDGVSLGQAQPIKPWFGNYEGDLGPGWAQQISGSGSGTYASTGTQPNPPASWYGAAGSVSATNTLAGVNAQQTVAFSGGVPTAGEFSLGLAGSTATGIPYNASPATVQSALEALPTIGAGNVSVGGQPGTYPISFLGGMGAQAVPPLTATSNLTGSDPQVTVATTIEGMPASAIGGLGANSVTITTGENVQAPATGTPGSPGQGAPDPLPDETPTISVFGWFNTGQTNGISGLLSAGAAILSVIVDGVATVIATAVNIVATIAKAVVTLVTEIIEVAVGVVQQVASLVVNGIKVVTGIIGEVIGTVFEAIGFGSHAGNDENIPPPVTGVSAGTIGGGTIIAGHLSLTNFGDQDGWPRYLVYGPGTFRIANGPGGEMVEFGPLVSGQIALLTTLPRLRGVVDLTPNIPTPPVLTQFQDLISRLISLATNNNIPPLLEVFQSLFGISPPQGAMYPLLRGRFTNPIPPKPTGQAPPAVSIGCQIIGGNSNSKIIAALTPLRRWPA